MSDENIDNITKSDSNFAPTFVDHHLLSGISLSENCLIKNNIYISKKVTPWLSNLNTNVKVTRNADPQSVTKITETHYIFMKKS